jgi:uncharacterized heparinase superfamily protein
LLAGRFVSGGETVELADLDFRTAIGAHARLAEQLQGFSWLRDLAAAATREKGAALAEAIAGRWLLAPWHQGRCRLGAGDCGASGCSSGLAYAPYILSSRDAGYRSALLNTMARGARHLDATPTRRARPAADHRLGGLTAAACCCFRAAWPAARAEAGCRGRSPPRSSTMAG